MLLIYDYFVSNQPEGGGVGSRVGSGQALRGSSRVRQLALEVGSGPDPGGSGPKNWTREQLCLY